VEMELSRFGLTVCLNALHSKDGQPFEVAEAGSCHLPTTGALVAGQCCRGWIA